MLRAVAAPNPVAGARLRLSLQTEGPADQVLVRIYSPALVCVRQAEAPGAAKGWSQLTVGLDGLSPGLYHCQVRLKRGQALSSPALVAFYFEGRP